MSFVDVCRLCLGKENLVWIFHKRFGNSEDMKNVIYITTGVEITDTDIISQKVCEKCCQVTIKMFQFRRRSFRNDNHLRMQCKKIFRNIKVPNMNVTTKNYVKETLNEKPVLNEKKELKPVHKMHPSIWELSQEYPQIVLPAELGLESHITPVVSMELDIVESYFRQRKLDIVEHTKLALKSGMVATKKTSAPAKLKTPQSASSNSIANLSRCESKDQQTPRPRIGPASKIAERSSHHSVTQSRITPDFSKLKTSEREQSVDRKIIPRTKSTREVTPEGAPAVKKIKLSEYWETPKKEALKLNVVESLSLVSKSTPIESPGLLSYVANTSVPLHICSICNSVQYSAKELQRHQLKHLRCQFCKLKCKSSEQKRLHIESDCVIKNTMNNLPNVYLDKIEFNLQVRRKYPEAFIDFPAIEGMYDVENRPSGMESSDSEADDNLGGVDSPDDQEDVVVFDNTETLPLAINKYPLRDNGVQVCSIPPKDENTTPPKDSTANPKLSPDDIIEILSDDEDEAPASSASASQNKLKEMILIDKSVDGKLTLPLLLPVARRVPVALVEKNVVYNSVSIVKPKIKIKGAAILDNMDPKTTDIQVLRELLTIYKPVQLLVEKQVQTELPCDRAITKNHAKMATELNSLKQQLHAYKIPVVLKNGPFNVSYNYQKEHKRQKKLNLWNDLTPIDLKSTHVNLTVSSCANMSLPVSSSANVNLPVSSSPNVSVSVPSSANVSLPVSNSTNINLPISSSSIASLLVSNSVRAVTSQNSNVQNNSVAIMTYPTFSNSVARTANIVNMNPILNNYAEMQNASATVVISAPIPTTSQVGTNDRKPVGVIRVKNMWELT